MTEQSKHNNDGYLTMRIGADVYGAAPIDRISMFSKGHSFAETNAFWTIFCEKWGDSAAILTRVEGGALLKDGRQIRECAANGTFDMLFQVWSDYHNTSATPAWLDWDDCKKLLRCVHASLKQCFSEQKGSFRVRLFIE